MKKRITFLATAFLLVASCTKDGDVLDGDVLVRFRNSMKEDITSSYMDFGMGDVTDVGPIAADSTTDYILFEHFSVGSGEPSGWLNGKIGDEDFSAWSGQWCGTGIQYGLLDPGHYTLEITKNEQLDSMFWYQLHFVDN